MHIKKTKKTHQKNTHQSARDANPGVLPALHF